MLNASKSIQAVTLGSKHDIGDRKLIIFPN